MERFWSKVQKTNYCWNWTASTNTDGYGHINIKGKITPSHRFIFNLLKGSIPKNMCVLHKCDNRKCVNPDHLFLGTHNDNMKDMVNKNRQSTDGGQEGEKHHSSKLTNEQVLAIRQEYSLGNITQKNLAKKYNIKQPQIHRIVTKKLWKHL